MIKAKAIAGSVEGYFSFDPDREDELRAIDALVRAVAGTVVCARYPR
jgi:hypothetical protein